MTSGYGAAMQHLLDYLRTRRSTTSVGLGEPGPTGDELRSMVAIASRVPDHGKLAPWRFVILTPSARERLKREIDALRAELHPGDQPKMDGETAKLLHGPALVMVLSRSAPHVKIPEWEQVLSAGAACHNLLLAANAHGYEAQWLTAWYVYEARGRAVLGLDEHERVAGLIHVGTGLATKTERDRPALDDILTTLDA